ncbi:orotidine-5'-phosphate decarboxylase [Corynebacterium freiburgense]|uniref:orotidine-5'-phosphate decarboxylase n=1 Tax=Corynebacterium freiburgense TaxID=556548 RepID=UPI0003FD000C|nr:orotidine-5'-phosphate decarboxylase [Corynebacterium freiburgense]WJZ02780.1 orotidine 5'-phosphate decarboxylase [Corynebacterium freiburgense]
MTFGEQLLDVASTRGRLCAGIDPHPSLLTAWGLPVSVAGLEEFSKICTEAFADTVALIKPQVAFYEVFGSAGFAILEHMMAALRAQGALIVADAKRGDIGSTMAAYAAAWLESDSPLCADAVTVSPFLGYGSLAPALELAEKNSRGVFVLAATSNPEGQAIQSCINTQGATISQQIVDAVAADNAQHQIAGNIGVVIGATLSDTPELKNLRGPILMPGVGAQGASAKDVSELAQGIEHLVFPNMSRGILLDGPNVADLRKRIAFEAQNFPGFPR